MIFVFDSIPHQNKIQELRDIVVSMCDEAAYDCVAALKFIPGWFVKK